MDVNYIRNFCIIAHIDHGKSTLADRLIEKTKAISTRKMKAQVLDTMDIERERGITIKSQSITLEYYAKDSKMYRLNLIDTPGHVDFSYEVSRSLAACEAALLLIDAAQGIQAQTLANLYQALEHNLEIIPIINKIDLPNADIPKTRLQIEKDLGLNPKDIIEISAKSGIGIENVLEKIVKACPLPTKNDIENNINNPPKALIFDAKFDYFRGVIITIRVFDGKFSKGDRIKFFKSDTTYIIEDLGIYQLDFISQDSLQIGEVGYIIANIKNISHTKVGDTITSYHSPCADPLPGYKEITPMIFCGLYPIDGSEFPLLKKSIEKLSLSDASFIYEPEVSSALGSGYRCGFLGLLHMEIIQERFKREFKIELINTIPSVRYPIMYKNGEKIIIENPSEFPDKHLIDWVEEPFASLNIISPKSYLGKILELCYERRGIQKNISYLDNNRIKIDFEIPISEVIYEMHDHIKNISQGYASYDYEFIRYEKSDLVRMDILVNQKRVDAFSHILHREKVERQARSIIKILQKAIPKHLFQVSIQAAIGAKIIARENISALRKNVTSKCYGGDITRKRKLIEKQKEGKKKMKSIGSVNIPQEAFLAIFKSSFDDKKEK